MLIVLARRMVGEGPIDVMAYVKIWETIAVEVSPSGARAPERIGKAGGPRDLLEAATPAAVRNVVKQREPAIAGDQQIGPAVVVVIGHGAAVVVEPRLAVC